MKHQNTAPIIFTIMCLFVPLHSHAKEASSSILPDKKVLSLGFRTTKNYKYNNLCRHYEKTSPNKVSYQGIKSIKAVKGTKRTYYRFTLIKEVYYDDISALNSLKKIKNTQGNSWYSKSCGIKKGVRIKNTLYFLVTDVGAFRPELTPLLNKIIDQLNESESSDEIPVSTFTDTLN